MAVGASYAAVPLYRMFCAATGFAGTPKVGTGRFEAERLVPVEGARRIKVHFNADKSEQLPWTFTPQQKFVSVLPGETSLAFYKAKNTSDRDIIGIATYNVTPDRVGLIHFFKAQHRCIYYIDRALFLQSGMFLLRRAAFAGRRRSGHASTFLLGQRHA
jgi:cytochrome c oxidase assembly protein Cox11